MLENLSLKSLGDLDEGAARAIIDAAIREAVADLDDRGSDRKPRQVNIQINLSLLENNQVSVDVDAYAKLPRRRTASTFGRLRREGPDGTRVQFQTLASQEPDQRTIDEYLDKDD